MVTVSPLWWGIRACQVPNSPCPTITSGYAVRNAGLPGAEFSFSQDHIGVRGAELLQAEYLVGFVRHHAQSRAGQPG